jgi:hypothetical protein
MQGKITMCTTVRSTTPINDGDGQVNEDHVDGKDDDADGVTDEDWWGGNSEPETKFIQDMTEMNDDTGDGSSEFKATITHHSYSELILYPWGHCTDCESPDHEQLKYHGQQMADMTEYANPPIIRSLSNIWRFLRLALRGTRFVLLYF